LQKEKKIFARDKKSRGKEKKYFYHNQEFFLLASKIISEGIRMK